MHKIDPTNFIGSASKYAMDGILLLIIVGGFVWQGAAFKAQVMEKEKHIEEQVFSLNINVKEIEKSLRTTQIDVARLQVDIENVKENVQRIDRRVLEVSQKLDTILERVKR